jgi:hypothetical protein
METTMSVQRLEMLRALVFEIRAEDLNVGSWCGCIGGRAAADHRFQAQGLGVSAAGVPIYCGVSGFEALALFFGIGIHEADLMFSSSGYPDCPRLNDGVSHQAVHARIDRLLAAARVKELMAAANAATPALRDEEACPAIELAD